MWQTKKKTGPLAFWQIKIFWALAILILALPSLWDIFAQQEIVEPGSDSQQYYRVINVVDGDTLDVDVFDEVNNKPFTRIRLRGVDTPETKHPNKPVEYFGPEATAFAEALVLDQQVRVVLDPDQESRDRYGRLLAYIYLPDGKMLNKELIINGFGYAERRFDHLLRAEFIDLEKRARSQKVGLWENIKPEQLPSWLK